MERHGSHYFDAEEYDVDDFDTDEFDHVEGDREGGEQEEEAEDSEEEAEGEGNEDEEGIMGEAFFEPEPFMSDSDEVLLDSVTDTTASQARRGKDIQGIPWQRLHFTREKYRETRLLQYKNYENLIWPHELLEQDSKPFSKDSNFFDFRYNTRSVKSTIVHFQLRNLVWATTKHDVYVMHHYAVNHWNALSKKTTEVINLGGRNVLQYDNSNRFVFGREGAIGGRVQISTMCVRENLLVAGGFHSEMVCKRLDSHGVAFSSRITHDESAITNAIDIFSSPSGALRIMSSNNDSFVRTFDAQTFEVLSRQYFPWPVNHTSVHPNGKVLLVVGDNPETLLADLSTGKTICSLKGHLDYSFASAWHPDGHLFATGNQDTSARIWDTRKLSSSLYTLRGRMGAIRSIRFTSDGRFMAMSEPADFVHVFDTSANFSKSQEIDLFGEIAGISFSLDDESFYVGIADRTYGSLLEFSRRRYNKFLRSFI